MRDYVHSTVVMCLVFLVGSSFVVGSPTKEPKCSLPRPDEVDAYIRTEMGKRKIPGVALAIVKDGRVINRQVYGKASIELNVPVKPTTVFLLASVTKVFTSAAILSLVEEGRLSLDDSITKLLPDLPRLWAPVTVRHCLSHTSGLPDSLDENFIAIGHSQEIC